MNRVAAFVDAGYFWVQCSQLLFNDKRGRGDIFLDVVRMREKLLEIIRTEFPHATLLRVYWYDGLGTDGNPTDLHRRIHELDDFKVRYGTRNLEGKQKGIDGLLMADLIGLAQNRGITDALILSGDGDLTPGVAAAQTLGVRVHRLEMGAPDASSPALRAEVDRNVLWSPQDVETFITPNLSHHDPSIEELDGQEAFGLGTPHSDPDFFGPEDLTGPVREQDEALLRGVAENFSHEMEMQGIAKSFLAMPAIPPDIDKRLLFAARTALGRKLFPGEKVILRSQVKTFLQQQDQTPPSLTEM